MSQGHFSDHMESPIALIAYYYPRKESLTHEMKTASGVGCQKNWRNVSWIGGTSE